MEHLTKEILLSYIDDSIDNNQKDECEKHFSDCVQCFTLYASYKQAHHEIISAELEKTPSDLINRVLPKLYPIAASKTETNLFDNVIQKISSLLSPKLIPAGIALMAIVTIFRVYQPEVNYSNNDVVPDSNERLRAWQQPKNNVEQATKKHDYEIITFYEPKKQLNLRNSSGFRVPDLSGKSLKDITQELQKKHVRHIVYRAIKFKQSPQPGTYLSNDDTLKIFINLN